MHEKRTTETAKPATTATTKRTEKKQVYFGCASAFRRVVDRTNTHKLNSEDFCAIHFNNTSFFAPIDTTVFRACVKTMSKRVLDCVSEVPWNPFPFLLDGSGVYLYQALVFKIAVLYELYGYMYNDDNVFNEALDLVFSGLKFENTSEALYQVHVYLNLHVGASLAFENDYMLDYTEHTQAALEPIQLHLLHRLYYVQAESEDYVASFCKTHLDAECELNEGSLFDLTPIVCQTKMFGVYDIKNMIIQILNKLFPVKCGTKTLSIMISKLAKNRDDDPAFYEIMYVAVMCTLLCLYRHNHNKALSFEYRRSVYRDYALFTAPARTPKDVIMKFVSGAVVDDLMLRYIIKEYIVFMFTLMPGAREAMIDKMQWNKYEDMVVDGANAIRTRLYDDPLDYIGRYLNSLELNQKEIIFKCAKKTYPTVAVEQMRTILVEYMMDLIAKTFLEQRPSQHVHGSMGVDIEHDSYFIPSVDELHGVEVLKDVFDRMESVYAELDHTSLVDTRVLIWMGVSKETIFCIANSLLEYGKFPIESHVYAVFKKILYGRFSSAMDAIDAFPEKEFLIAYRFFQHNYNLVNIYTVNLPRQYFNSQVVALNRRSGLVESESSTMATGEIGFCSTCKNIVSFVSTPETPHADDYGTQCIKVDPFERDADGEYMRYCAPAKNESLIVKNIQKMAEVSNELIGNADKIYYKLEKEEIDRRLYTLVHSIMSNTAPHTDQMLSIAVKLVLCYRKMTESFFELAIQRSCVRTPIKFVNIVGRALVMNLPKQKGKQNSSNTYFICPKCGCFTTFSVRRLQAGMCFCGVCNDLVYYTTPDSDMLMATSSPMCFICNTSVKKNDAHVCLSRVIDDAIVIPYVPYQPRVEFDMHGTKTLIVEAHMCGKHYKPWMDKYVSMCNQLYESDSRNYPYPLSSILKTGIEEKWARIEFAPNYDFSEPFDIRNSNELKNRVHTYDGILCGIIGTYKAPGVARALKNMRSKTLPPLVGDTSFTNEDCQSNGKKRGRPCKQPRVSAQRCPKPITTTTTTTTVRKRGRPRKYPIPT